MDDGLAVTLVLAGFVLLGAGLGALSTIVGGG